MKTPFVPTPQVPVEGVEIMDAEGHQAGNSIKEIYVDGFFAGDLYDTGVYADEPWASARFKTPNEHPFVLEHVEAIRQLRDEFRASRPNAPKVEPAPEPAAVTPIDAVLDSVVDYGGPAFPVSAQDGVHGVVWGMDLRDYFAAKAMQSGLDKMIQVVHLEGKHLHLMASSSYRVADAMLRARSAPSHRKPC